MTKPDACTNQQQTQLANDRLFQLQQTHVYRLQFGSETMHQTTDMPIVQQPADLLNNGWSVICPATSGCVMYNQPGEPPYATGAPKAAYLSSHDVSHFNKTNRNRLQACKPQCKQPLHCENCICMYISHHEIGYLQTYRELRRTHHLPAVSC